MMNIKEIKETLNLYKSLQFKPVLYTGFYQKYNPNKDYKKGKIPVSKGWTKEDYKIPTEKECLNWLKKDGWIGFLIPKNVIVLDIDDDINKDQIPALLKEKNITAPTHQSRNGFHNIFKTDDNIKSDSQAITKSGCPITYRAGGTSCIIFYPSDHENRKWIIPLPDSTDKLPELPEELKQIDKYSKDELLNALSYQIGYYCRGNNILSGFLGVDFAYCCYLVKDMKLTDIEIHNHFKTIFSTDYDHNRTEYLIFKTREDIKTSKKTIGIGTLIEKLKENSLEHIHNIIKILKKFTQKNQGKTETKKIIDVDLHQLDSLIDAHEAGNENSFDEICEQISNLFGYLQKFYIKKLHDKDNSMSKAEIEKHIEYKYGKTINTKDEPLNKKNEILEGNYTEFNAAQDFVNNTAYLSIPELVGCKENGVIINFEKKTKIITSEKISFYASDYEELEKRKLIPLSAPYYSNASRSRWNIKYYNEYLKKTGKINPLSPFMQISQIFNKYIEYPENNTESILALWTMGTYVHQMFQTYPYILFSGTQESGKTKNLNIMERLCFNAKLWSDTTSANIFRVVHNLSATLLLDEAENLKNTKNSEKAESIRLLLNSGNKKGATASRQEKNEKGKFFEVEYHIFSPKAIACITGLESVLGSRCILICMIRGGNIHIINREVTENSEDWAYIRNLCYRFALEYFQDIYAIYTNDNNFKQIKNINGRELEKWKSLLSISLFLEKHGGHGLFETVCEIAQEKGKEKPSGLKYWEENTLLYLKKNSLNENEEFIITTTDILEELENDLSIKNYMPSSKTIGIFLKKFNLIKDKKKINNIKTYSIDKNSVLDICGRYTL